MLLSPKSFRFALISVFALNLLDCILSAYFISYLQEAEELNPLMDFLLQGGVSYFVLVKISLVSLGLTLLNIYSKNTFSQLAIVFLLFCYAFIFSIFLYYGLQIFFLASF